MYIHTITKSIAYFIFSRLIMQVEQKVVELVPGYGVTLTQRGVTLTQRQVISSSGSSPTRMIRLLMSAFFDEDVLATSSCFGSGFSHSKLDEDVIAACIRKNIQFILHIMLCTYIYLQSTCKTKFMWQDLYWLLPSMTSVPRAMLSKRNDPNN